MLSTVRSMGVLCAQYSVVRGQRVVFGGGHDRPERKGCFPSKISRSRRRTAAYCLKSQGGC